MGYMEPHPIFYAQQQREYEAELRAELNAERERRVAAERRAVLTAQERTALANLGKLKDDLSASRFLNVYLVLMLVLSVAIARGWV